MVGALDQNDWNLCEDEQKKEFQQVFDKFATELKEALRSLQNNINLETYEPKWENEARNI